jgi:hypothetical protein
LKKGCEFGMGIEIYSEFWYSLFLLSLKLLFCWLNLNYFLDKEQVLTLQDRWVRAVFRTDICNLSTMAYLQKCFFHPINILTLYWFVLT